MPPEDSNDPSGITPAIPNQSAPVSDPPEPTVRNPDAEITRVRNRLQTLLDKKKAQEDADYAAIPPFNSNKPSILCEDGRIIKLPLDPNRPEKVFRLTVNGENFEHCADHPNGRWIYRSVMNK